MRPVLKTIYKPPVYLNEAYLFTLGREVFEIPDEDGEVSKLFKLMDGINTIDKIAELMGAPLQDIVDTIESLNEYKLVEDIDADKCGLSEYSIKKNRANFNHFNNFTDLSLTKYQILRKLADSEVCILGLGGASIIGTALVGLGVGKISGADFDVVELSNLNRQFLYNTEDIGKLKSDSLYNRLSKMSDEVEVVVHNKKIDSTKMLEPIIKSANVVVSGIDTPQIVSRRWVNSACVQLKKPYVQAGISNGAIAWQSYRPGSACFDCYLIDCMVREESYGEMLAQQYGRNFSGNNTTIAPNATLICGFLTNEIFRMITGLQGGMQPSEINELNTVTMSPNSSYQWPKYDKCPTCGKDHSGESIGYEIGSLEELIEIARQIREDQNNE